MSIYFIWVQTRVRVFGVSSKTELLRFEFLVLRQKMCNMEPPLLSFHTLKLTQCVNLALPCLRGQQVDKELGWGNVSLWASEWSVDGKWCLFLPATTNVNEMQTCKKKKKKTFKTVIQPINRKWLGLGPQIFLPVPRADNEKKNTKHLSFRAIFNWVSKSNLGLLWFSFISLYD